MLFAAPAAASPALSAAAAAASFAALPAFAAASFAAPAVFAAASLVFSAAVAAASFAVAAASLATFAAPAAASLAASAVVWAASLAAPAAAAAAFPVALAASVAAFLVAWLASSTFFPSCSAGPFVSSRLLHPDPTNATAPTSNPASAISRIPRVMTAPSFWTPYGGPLQVVTDSIWSPVPGTNRPGPTRRVLAGGYAFKRAPPRGITVRAGPRWRVTRDR